MMALPLICLQICGLFFFLLFQHQTSIWSPGDPAGVDQALVCVAAALQLLPLLRHSYLFDLCIASHPVVLVYPHHSQQARMFQVFPDFFQATKLHIQYMYHFFDSYTSILSAQ